MSEPDRNRLPTFIVIGAMKCGTSSLHFYLSHHPEISASAEKELNFFMEEQNWGRGLEWYASQFGPARARGETSPRYTWFERFPGVPERMHGILPDAKLIYLVRDPVEQVISHWIHNYSRDRENRPLREAIRRPRYVERTSYWNQLSKYVVHYPARQILVLDAHELLHQRGVAMKKVFEFVGVDPEFGSPAFASLRHESTRQRRKWPVARWLAHRGLEDRIHRLPQPWRWRVNQLVFLPFSRAIRRPGLTGGERAWFLDQVRDDVAQLREFTGQEFASWSV